MKPNRSVVVRLVLATSLLTLSPVALATTTEWMIQEVYSNADGSIQFIELYTTAANQDLLATDGLRLVVTTSGGSETEFAFDSDLLVLESTADRTVLVANPGYAALPVPPPADYLIDSAERFFDPGAMIVTVQLKDSVTVFDEVSFLGPQLVDCEESINYPGAILAPNSPENFAGDTTFPLSCCTANDDCPSDGIACTVSVCDFLMRTCSYVPVDEVCDNGVYCDGEEYCDPLLDCRPGVSPCAPDEICDEPLETCVECFDHDDCDDSDICTVDSCSGMTCFHDPVPPPEEVQQLMLGRPSLVGGPAVVSLDWTAAPGATSYRVYRGRAPALTDLGCFASGLTGTSTVDDGAVPSRMFVFLVGAVGCGPLVLGENRPAAPACP